MISIPVAVVCWINPPHPACGFRFPRHHQDFGTFFGRPENPILNLDLPRLNPGGLIYPSSLTPKNSSKFLQVAVQGTLEAKKTLRQPLETLGSPVADQLYQQTKVAHLMLVAIFCTAIPSRGFFKETPRIDGSGGKWRFLPRLWEKGGIFVYFCPFGVFFFELHSRTLGFDIGIFCWFIPPKKILVA